MTDSIRKGEGQRFWARRRYNCREWAERQLRGILRKISKKGLRAETLGRIGRTRGLIPGGEGVRTLLLTLVRRRKLGGGGGGGGGGIMDMKMSFLQDMGERALVVYSVDLSA